MPALYPSAGAASSMLDPLDAIAEGIVCEHLPASGQVAAGPDLDAITREGVREGLEVVHDEGGVLGEWEARS